MQKIKDRAIKRAEALILNKEFSRDIKALMAQEKPDQETLRCWKKISEARHKLTDEAKIQLAVEKTVKLVMGQQAHTKEYFVPLVLTDAGDLFREPKDKYCYPLQSSGLRLQIIKTLIGKKEFYPSHSLMSDINKYSYGSLTYAIGQINRQAANKLGLPKGRNLIVSKRFSGYMLNELYPVTEK